MHTFFLTFHYYLFSEQKPTNPTKISFLAEEDNRKIGIIVEPRAPSFGIITPSRCGTRCWTFIQQLAQKNISFEAHGFFFNKSVETGKIDLRYDKCRRLMVPVSTNSLLLPCQILS